MIIEEANKFGRLSEIELQDFEVANSILFPNEYKEFLLKYNGGHPEPNIVPQVRTDLNWIYGMHQDPDWASFYFAVDIFHSRIPSWYVPIGSNSFGNQFIMSLYSENHGVIALWHHEQETMGDADQYFDNVTFVANSFTELLNSLIPSPNW
jgi:hypothetical protein